MRLKKYLNEKLDFKDEHIDSYSGQQNFQLSAYVDDKFAGYLDYTTFKGEVKRI